MSCVGDNAKTEEEPEGPKEDEQQRQTSNNYHTISSGVDDSFVALIVVSLRRDLQSHERSRRENTECLAIVGSTFIEEMKLERRSIQNCFGVYQSIVVGKERGTI